MGRDLTGSGGVGVGFRGGGGRRRPGGEMMRCVRVEATGRRIFVGWAGAGQSMEVGWLPG